MIRAVVAQSYPLIVRGVNVTGIGTVFNAVRITSAIQCVGRNTRLDSDCAHVVRYIAIRPYAGRPMKFLSDGVSRRLSGSAAARKSASSLTGSIGGALAPRCDFTTSDA
jgi:hypothetical protein